MKLHLIMARTRAGVIGHQNTLPWHLPEDLAHFKRLTQGCPVIMGRNTWESLPPRWRPLPGRTNIVVTRNPHWHADGAHAATSLAQALALCQEADTAWVIGGAQLYAAAQPLSCQAVITEIDIDTAGDAFAPQFLPPWHETAREEHTAANGLRYRFITLQQPQGV